MRILVPFAAALGPYFAALHVVTFTPTEERPRPNVVFPPLVPTHQHAQRAAPILARNPFAAVPEATQFGMSRAALDKILEDQVNVRHSVRIVPDADGIRFYGIKEDSLLHMLGIKNGDRLETINGYNIATPDRALEAYARLRMARHLTVRIQRAGRPLLLEYDVNG